jgi:hypothetical protein
MSAIVPYKPNEVAMPKMRLRCTICPNEVGMSNGSFEDALKLLENAGWKIRPNLICPDCLMKKAQKFKEKFFK